MQCKFWQDDADSCQKNNNKKHSSYKSESLDDEITHTDAKELGASNREKGNHPILKQQHDQIVVSIKLNTNDILIKLPEKNFFNALNFANKIIYNNKFNSNKVIDLRISNYMIISNE